MRRLLVAMIVTAFLIGGCGILPCMVPGTPEEQREKLLKKHREYWDKHDWHEERGDRDVAKPAPSKPEPCKPDPTPPDVDKPDKPGHGYGDDNHNHTGPPGQTGSKPGKGKGRK